MGEVTYLDDYRAKKAEEEASANMEEDVTNFLLQSEDIVTDEEGRVLVHKFNPYNTDLQIIRALVYNIPSLMDSYYAMYRDSTFVVRYEDYVVIKNKHTMEDIQVVVHNNGQWFAYPSENVEM